MRTVDDHRALVAALLEPAPTELVPLGEALGRVLAEDVTAAVAIPSFDNSAMDGYAVRAADLAGATGDAPVRLPVAADVPAGRTDGPALEPGTAHRIMTGALFPPGADAVVPVEQTDGGTTTVALSAAPDAGAFVRRAGEDTRVGDVVLTAGTPLGPAHIGVAAATGSATLPVRRRPLVLVLSTGSELVAPGEPLRPGQIHESNGPMLAAAVTEAGGRAELLRFVPDDVEQFLDRLRGRVARADDPVDLVLTSGGVSAGAYEVVKDAFTGRGVEFVKVAMQPGGPQGAGRLTDLDGVAVVTLPGNPVSSQVSFEVFVRPALRAALGHPRPDRPVRRAVLGERWTSPSGRRQFRRGVLDADGVTVREVGTSGSHMLGAMARAGCLVVVPEQATDLGVGTELEIWSLEG